MERNLTTGSVGKNILIFSLPYLLSYFLQTLYGMADLFIIGQFDGVASTTAVSIGSQVMHMLTVMLVGLAMGTTVSIARAVGGRNHKQVSENVGNTVTLFFGLSIVLTVVLLLLVRPIVGVMSTPAEAVDGTVAYLTICFLGIPFITAYNIISSIFRGMGDSKSPMYFIAIACAANIMLDYLFIGALGFGPAGAALGTTLAQTISVAVSLFMILRRKSISLSKGDFHPRRSVVGQILQIGVPVALQDGLIQIAFIVITIIANRRGLNDAAAVGIVEKIIGFVFLSIMSAAYCEEQLENGESRVVLKLPAALAPVKLAVMPLIKKDGLPEKAREIIDALKFHFHCQYDEKDSIGKRYRRQDAIGTPFCVTVDHQTLEDNCVTLRNRDTMQQERVAISELNNIIADRVSITSLLKTLQ